MTRSVIAVAVVVLVVAGGVGHVAASAAPDASTASDAPSVVQSNETNETADGPPGVSNGTVTNVSALLAAHNRSLAATGYRFTFRENVSFTFDGNESLNASMPNESGLNRSASNASNLSGVTPDRATAGALGGSPGALDSVSSNTTERGSVAEGLAPSLVRSDGRVQLGNRTAAVTSETWANETLMLVRFSVANQVSVQRVDLARNATRGFLDVTRDHVNATVTKAQIVNLTLHTGNFSVADVNESGNRTLYTLEASSFTGSDHLWLDLENVSEYDATVVVDEQGTVHRLTLDVVAEDAAIHYDFELTQVGAVEVERPSWTAAALGAGANATGNATVAG